MSITISGTTGIAGVDGSAGTPAVQGNDTNTGIFFPSADTIAFAEGGTEVARFDSSGNLLVNTTTAQTGAKLAVTGGIQGTITSGTSVAASTTIVNFTGIPSWVKRVTVLFNGVSGSGTSNLLLQLGDGSIVTSGYNSCAHTVNTSNSSSTAGLLLTSNSVSTTAYYGIINLVTMGSNVWVSSHNFGGPAGNYNNFGGGSITLSGTLDRLRITTVNGTDTFDAGTINILYEG